MYNKIPALATTTKDMGITKHKTALILNEPNRLIEHVYVNAIQNWKYTKATKNPKTGASEISNTNLISFPYLSLPGSTLRPEQGDSGGMLLACHKNIYSSMYSNCKLIGITSHGLLTTSNKNKTEKTSSEYTSLVNPYFFAIMDTISPAVKSNF